MSVANELRKIVQEELGPIKSDLEQVREKMTTKEDLKELREATARGFQKTEEYLKQHGKAIEELKENLSITIVDHGDRIKRLEEQHPELPPYKSPYKSLTAN